MNHTHRQFLIPTLLLSSALVLGGCSVDDDSTAPADGDSTTQDTADVAQHNDADVEFAQDMIPHHAQAITMADMVLVHEGSTLTELAEQIKAAQQPEIDEMTGWLNAWGEDVPDAEGHMGMGGMDMDEMMSQDDLDALMDMDGSGFDSMWLQMMIEHHEGAIEMAQAQIADGQHPDALDLAARIVSAQQSEIDQMRDMLESLAAR
jgi:uncharacterized protein (DUF305 family)